MTRLKKAEMTKFNYTTRSFFLFLLIWAIASLELSAQNCVGTPGQVKWSYWTAFNNVFPDSTDLAALENFPSRPDGSQLLSSLKAPVNYTEYFAAMARQNRPMPRGISPMPCEIG
jgi:hypothetical protein